MLSHKTIHNLPNNNRFYILLFSFFVSVFVVCLLRTQLVSNQLFYIRLEQVFGFIALVYLYSALIIAPLERTLGKPAWFKHITFARRAIGVSAAYFAVLHVCIALWGQIGGLGGVMLLPSRFIWSLGFGVVALAVLLLMAATSFDKVIQFMTFRKWKWLHRFVYLGSWLIILHVWMIGTHVAYSWVQLATFIPLSLLFGLEAWCTVSKYSDRHPEFKAKDYAITLALCLWLILSLALLSVPALVQNYHSENHTKHDTSSSHKADDHE